MTIDIAKNAHLDLNTTNECLYNKNAGIHLTGEGSLTFSHRQSTAILCGGILAIDGELSVKGADIPSGSTAGALGAGQIKIAGNANIDVIGQVTTEHAGSSSNSVDGTLRVEGAAKLAAKTSTSIGVTVSGSNGVYISKGATVIATATAESNSPAISSMHGPCVIDGTAIVSSASKTGNAAISVALPDGPAYDIDISGTVVIKKASVGIANARGDTNVKPGALVTIENATYGILQPNNNTLTVDGATLTVSKTAVGLAVSQEGTKGFIVIKNGSKVTLDTSSINIYDLQRGTTGSAFTLGNSTLLASSGVGVSNMTPSLSYTRDANIAVGDTAESAQSVALDKINFTSKYISIVTGDHTWAPTWTTNATHHWHACTNSHCALDSTADVAQMDGYATHSGGEATYDDGAHCSVCGTEYTAPLPRPVVHRVTFDSNGGSAIEAVQVEDGNPVSEPAVPVREGYTFKGWYTDAQLVKPYNFAEPVTDDLTLYAKWEKDAAPEPKPDPEPVVHHVTFDSNGGTAVAAQKVEDGKTIVKPAAPTRDGHTFKGWFVDQQLTKPFDFADPVTGDVTLYAKWEKNAEPAPEPTTYRVMFDANGGGAIANQTVADGDPAVEPKDPVREGYAFEGWYADERLSEPYDFATPVTGDLTLYAKWEKVADTDKDDADKNGAGKDDADKNDANENTADKGDDGTGKTDGNATNDGKNNGGAADGNATNERKPETKTGKRSDESVLPQSGDASGSVAVLAVTGVLIAGAGIALSKRKNRGQ